MKAKSKGYISIKLYKVAEARTVQLRQKIVLTTAALLQFVILVPILEKT